MPTFPRQDEDQITREKHLSFFKALMLTLAALGVVSSYGYVGGFLVFVAGNGSWLAILIATILTMCIACSLSAFSRRYVVTGSIMSYLAEVFGPWARLLVASSYLIGYIVGCSAIGLGISYYLDSILEQLHAGIAGDLSTRISLLVLGISSAGILAYRGLDASATVVTGLTAISVPVLVIITCGVVLRQGIHLSPQIELVGVSPHSIITAVGIGFASYVLFDGCSSIASETDNPKRNVPFILLSGMTIVGLIVVIGCLIQIPVLTSHLPQLNEGTPPMVVLANEGGVGFLALPISVMFAAASFSALVATLSFASRIVATAASDGLLPQWFSDRQSKYDTAGRSLMTLGITSIVLPTSILLATGAPSLTMITYFSTAVSYFWIPPYLLVCLGAIKLYIKERRLISLPPVVFATGVVGVLFVTVYNLCYPHPGLLGKVPYMSLGGTFLLFLLFTFREQRRVRIHEREILASF